MGSLREGIEKAQFQTEPSTSMLAVAEKFALQPPISVSRLAWLLKPQTVDWDTGPASLGDDGDLVKASAHLWLSSTGFWRFTGEVRDSGDGASFGIVMTPKFIDASGTTLFFAESNELSDDENYVFSKDGRNLWFGRNWDAIVTHGFSWKMNASTTMGIGEIIVTVLIPVIAIGGAIFGAAHCNENDSWQIEKNPDGSNTAKCNIK